MGFCFLGYIVVFFKCFVLGFCRVLLCFPISFAFLKGLLGTLLGQLQGERPGKPRLARGSEEHARDNGGFGGELGRLEVFIGKGFQRGTTVFS